jgi:hypothetical protein
VIDITNPASPGIVGSVDTPGLALDVAVVGSYAYVADSFSGLQIVPAQCDEPVAVLIQSFEARGVESGVELAWDIEADEEIKGFRIYRGANEQAPDELVNTSGVIPAESRSYLDGDVSGGGKTYRYTLAVVTADDSEIRSQSVMVRTSARSLALHQNRPNPFNPTTSISFTLPNKARVDLSVYNLQGQLVKTLVSEALDAGIKEVVWNGTDARGDPVASGVYFYRLKAGKKVLTRKMVHLK